MYNHQWRKHGTCGKSHPSINTHYKFFKAAVDLRKRLDIDGILRSSGIVPDNNKIYEVSRIKQALERVHGKNIIVTCRENNTLIFELYICYDKNFVPIDCPHQRPPTCTRGKLIKSF